MVVYSGVKWVIRSECAHVLRRIRTHHRRQEPAHASGPVPRCAGRRSRAHGAVSTRILDVFARADWDALVEARLAPLDPFTKEARELKRFFFSAASDAELDKQGRVLVPPALHRHARLGREVVVAGVNDRLEIWDRTAWAAHVTDGRRERRRCCRTSCSQARLITSPFSRMRCASPSACNRARPSSTRRSAPAATRRASPRISAATAS